MARLHAQIQIFCQGEVVRGLFSVNKFKISKWEGSGPPILLDPRMVYMQKRIPLQNHFDYFDLRLTRSNSHAFSNVIPLGEPINKTFYWYFEENFNEN